MSEAEQEQPLEADPATVKQWMDAGQVTLIDCREPDEYEVAKIEGSILLPMQSWDQAGPKLEELNGQHLVVHCHHGMRSLRVVHWLRANGFPDATSMRAGIDGWSRDVDPSVPTY